MISSSLFSLPPLPPCHPSFPATLPFLPAFQPSSLHFTLPPCLSCFLTACISPFLPAFHASSLHAFHPSSLPPLSHPLSPSSHSFSDPFSMLSRHVPVLSLPFHPCNNFFTMFLGPGVIAATASIPSKYQTVFTDNADRKGFLSKTKRFDSNVLVSHN